MTRLQEVLARVLGVSAEEISDDSSPQSIESWDSFNGLLLVDELEKTFSVSFSMDEVMDVQNVADIKRHLRNHGVDVDE